MLTSFVSSNDQLEELDLQYGFASDKILSQPPARCHRLSTVSLKRTPKFTALAFHTLLEASPLISWISQEQMDQVIVRRS